MPQLSLNYRLVVKPALFGLMLILAARRMVETVPRDVWFAQLVHSTFESTAESPVTPLLPVSLAEGAYGRGWFAWRAGDNPTAESAWALAIGNDVRYVSVIRSVVPHNIRLATLATLAYPQRSESWAWLAGIKAIEDPVTAEGLYQHATALAPFDNLLWEQLSGVSLAAGDSIVAQAAAERACDLVPVRNGSCHTAARLAQAQGDWATVIYYYERGDYPEHIEDWVQLIVAAQKLGRTADAQRYLSQAQQELPANYEQLLKQANP